METQGVAAVVPRAEALLQLKDAWKMLSAIPQGRGASVTEVASAVAADELMRHAEQDVRLWDAMCLAECLRIFAPEPPFDAQRLRTILQSFIEQIAVFAEQMDTNFIHRVGLLEKLTEVHAFSLIFECPKPEALLVELVQISLSTFRAKGNLHVEGLLSQALVALLQEADEVPGTVIENLVLELSTKIQNTQQSDGVASRVLLGMAARCARQVNQLLLKALHARPGDGSEELCKLAENPSSVFEIIHQLFLLEPSLVSHVMPSLEVELRARDVDRRYAATKVIGSLLVCRTVSPTNPQETSVLLEAEPLLLDRFLDRFSDEDVKIRQAALDGAMNLFEAAAIAGGHRVGDHGSASEVAVVSAAVRARGQLVDRCLDPSVAVRLRAVEVAAEAASSTAGLDLLAPSLPEIFHRVRDKSPLVREASIEAAASLYKMHALPAWTEGRYEAAKSLAWGPQVLCEAYSLLAGGRLGHTAMLEEVLERYILGCEETFEAPQRALALLGFHASVAAGGEEAAGGFGLLMRRKLGANTMLKRYVELRAAKGSPLLASEGSLAIPGQTQQAGSAAEAMSILEAVARLSPAVEERASSNPNSIITVLRTLDAVRDRALWTLLGRLLGSSTPAPEVSVLSTSDLATHLQELARLLRVHGLTEIVPLLRRALLCTWLLPDQAAHILSFCSEEEFRNGAQSAADTNWVMGTLAAAAGQAVAELPRYFPDAFICHVGRLLKNLESTDAPQHVASGLQALGTLGKWMASGSAAYSQATGANHVKRTELLELLRQSHVLAAAEETNGVKVARNSAHSVGLLLDDVNSKDVSVKILQWAVDAAAQDKTNATGNSVGHLRLAAAHLENLRKLEGRRTGCHAASASTSPRIGNDVDSAEIVIYNASAGGHDHKKSVMSPAPLPDEHASWVATCTKILEDCSNDTARDTVEHIGSCTLVASEAKCNRAIAAVQLLASAGAQLDVEQVLSGHFCKQVPGLRTHAATAVLRALRHGLLCLSTSLLSALASALTAAGSDAAELDLLLDALRKFQKPTIRHMRLADILRLNTTLPTAFAEVQNTKRHEASQRILQSSLVGIARRAAAQQQPLLDYSVACFVHYLSHLNAFIEESSLAATAFPVSTRAATYFVDALLKSDPSKTTELAGIALHITESMRHFVDRERTAGDRISKAAWVLRYALEKQCPELASRSATRLQSATRVSMPAELFALKTDATSITPPPLNLATADPLPTEAVSQSQPTTPSGFQQVETHAGSPTSDHVPPALVSSSLLRSSASRIEGRNTADPGATLGSALPQLFKGLARQQRTSISQAKQNSSAIVAGSSHSNDSGGSGNSAHGNELCTPRKKSQPPNGPQQRDTPRKRKCSEAFAALVAGAKNSDTPGKKGARSTSSTSGHAASTPHSKRQRSSC